jgi:hypothetical protein
VSVQSVRNDYGYRGIEVEDTSGPRGGLSSEIFSVGGNILNINPQEVLLSVRGPRGGTGRMVRISLAEAEQFSRLLAGLLAELRAAEASKGTHRP